MNKEEGQTSTEERTKFFMLRVHQDFSSIYPTFLRPLLDVLAVAVHMTIYVKNNHPIDPVLLPRGVTDLRDPCKDVPLCRHARPDHSHEAYKYEGFLK